MAAGTKSDFKIYHEEFFGGMNEVLMQNVDVFNAASRGALRLVPQRIKGDYEKESFIKEIASLVTRRDVTSVAAADDIKMEQGEIVGVKINRKIGPVAQTRDAFKKIARNPQEFSFLLGQQSAKAVLVDYVNTAIMAAATALSGQSAVVVDKSSENPGTISHTYLIDGKATFGDAAGNIVCLVMHSKPYNDLAKLGISEKITNVADMVINTGNIGSMGLPVIITDSSSLVVQGTPDEYITLGLVADALVLAQSEEQDIESDLVTGLENLVVRIQGEYAYNLRVKGFAWDTGNGGANPTDGAIGTSSNWDLIAADTKALAGFYLRTN